MNNGHLSKEGTISVGELETWDGALALLGKQQEIMTADSRRSIALLLIRDHDIGIIEHNYGDKKRRVSAVIRERSIAAEEIAPEAIGASLALSND